MNCPKSALSQFIRALVSLQDEFKNSRKSRSRRGNEAEVFFAAKPASSAATILERKLSRRGKPTRVEWIIG